MKNKWNYLLTTCLVIGAIMFCPLNSFAVEIDEEAANEGITGRLQGNTPAEFYGVSEYSLSRRIIHADKFDDYIIEEGIDVSKWNGTINWKKVKNSGIDFAIIRLGARGYGASGTMIYDETFVTNLEGAQSAGLDTGVYLYSQATTKAEAIEEAEYVLNYLKGYNLELPVVFDYEYAAGGRLDRDKMTDRERTDVCKTFCKMIEAAGYDAMIYANRDMLQNDLYADELDDKYEIWLAEWNTKAKYTNDYTYWQYSADGDVSGISGDVDVNFRYYQPEFKASTRQADSIYLNWTEINNADGYNLYQKTEEETYQLVTTLEGNKNTSFVHTDLLNDTKYTYKISYYTTDEEGTLVEHDTEYPEITAHTLPVVKKVEVTAETVDAGSIQLNWNAVKDADGYVIQQYNASKDKYVTVKTITDESQLSFVREGLKIDTKYKFRVKAYISQPEGRLYGAYSKVACAITSSKLKKPVVNATVKSYSSIHLKWKKVSGATGYVIQRYDNSAKKYKTVKTITNGDTTSYTNTGLKEKTSYKYRVRAFADKSGEKIKSYFSVEQTVKTKARVATPKLNASRRSFSSIKLSWTKISNANGYEIQRYDVSKKKYVTIKTVNNRNTTTFNNIYLNANTTYKYRIRAYRVISGKTYYSYYSSSEAKTGKSRTAIVTCDKLNVRSGAGADYKRITTVQLDDELKVTGSRNGWYRISVKVNGKTKTGYVKKEYVKLINS